MHFATDADSSYKYQLSFITGEICTMVNTMRILIVEDDHKIASAIKQGLELESFAVDVEYDADSGLGAALA